MYAFVDCCRVFEYVYLWQLKADKLDFFPLNRAMCLLNIDDDDTNNLLDDATNLMKEIKQKQDMIVSYL